MHKVRADSVIFAALLDQEPASMERVRELRNALGVRQYMYSDHHIRPQEHADWIASLQGDPKQQVWVILYDGNVEGVVSLSAISQQQKSADWAFYLSQEMQGKGVGGVVEFKLLDLVFGQMRLEKLNCEVLASNPKVIEMHQKFGFQLEGIRRANVIKEGQRIDVTLLGILPHEWQQQRPRFARLYAML